MFMFKQDTHLLDSLSSTFALEISLVLIRFLSLLSILGLNLFFILIYMDVQLGEASQQPNKDVTQRLKKLMVGVQSEFRGHESAIEVEDGRRFPNRLEVGIHLAWKLVIEGTT
uniref:Uncharacterized protein n=2 Tax=Lactuca sativa TaxID=4236 RepID=A0A9R1WR94_LACSA|nr:hypothetical protein LSAT_V11C900501080 [Lactuca sativa]KAJ0187390.1 hypothetical protein LSAT_V11C900501060 [Lactuca sativa]